MAILFALFVVLPDTVLEQGVVVKFLAHYETTLDEGSGQAPPYVVRNSDAPKVATSWCIAPLVGAPAQVITTTVASAEVTSPNAITGAAASVAAAPIPAASVASADAASTPHSADRAAAIPAATALIATVSRATVTSHRGCSCSRRCIHCRDMSQRTGLSLLCVTRPCHRHFGMHQAVRQIRAPTICVFSAP